MDTILILLIIHAKLAQLDVYYVQVLIFVQHVLLAILFLRTQLKDNVFSVNPHVLPVLEFLPIVSLVLMASQKEDGNVKTILIQDLNSLFQILLPIYWPISITSSPDYCLF